jgi:hypothetical protein
LYFWFENKPSGNPACHLHFPGFEDGQKSYQFAPREAAGFSFLRIQK